MVNWRLKAIAFGALTEVCVDLLEREKTMDTQMDACNALFSYGRKALPEGLTSTQYNMLTSM